VPLRADRVELAHRSDVHPASRDHGRSDDRLGLGLGAELVLVEDLDAGSAGLEDVQLAVLGADIQLSVSERRRGLLDRPERLLPELLARGEIESADHGPVVDLVEALAVDDGGRVAALEAVGPPLRLLALELALQAGVERGDLAHVAPVEVLLAVRQIDGGAVDDDAREDGALAHLVAPDCLAGRGLERVDGAVAAPDDQQGGAVHRRHRRRRVVGVVVAGLGRGDPDRLAGLLVQGEVAVVSAGLVAPSRRERGDDDEVVDHDRRHRAAAVGRDGPELLGERTVPEELARGREGAQLARNAEDVDVAGLAVHGGGGPADAVGGHVRVVDVEARLPDPGAGVGVQADDALLHRVLVADRRVNVEPVAEDHRAGARAVGRLPGQVLTRRRPAGRQVLFARTAVLVGPPPVRPVVFRSRGINPRSLIELGGARRGTPQTPRGRAGCGERRE
jgi:hypothetical protein